MADQEKDKQMQIDEMLDSLLASYSSAEPRPGLETRILANIRDAEGREASRGWWNLKWVWAGMAFALAVAILIVFSRDQSPRSVPTQAKRPEIQQSSPKKESVPEQSVAGTKISAQVKHDPVREVQFHHRQSSPATRHESKVSAIFPTPTPLSEQEQLLLIYLANTPREEVVAQLFRNDQKDAQEFWDAPNALLVSRRSEQTR
jgi:hypothetical protein